MAEHVWSVLCHKASLDRDSNQISLLEVVEEVTFHGEKRPPKGAKDLGLPFHLEVASLWLRDDLNTPEVATCRIDLIAPDGVEVAGSTEVQISLSETMRFRSIVRMDVLPWRGFGMYYFRISKQSEGGDEFVPVASVPYLLKFKQLPKAMGAKQTAPRKQRVR